MTFLFSAIGAGASALCLAAISPNLRAAMLASNVAGGVAFLLLSWQLWMLRRPMKRQLPGWFVDCAVGFICLCGVHHLLHGGDVVFDLSWVDSGVTAIMAGVAWMCVVATGVALPGWLEKRGPRHDPINVAMAHNALIVLFKKAALGGLTREEMHRVAAKLLPVHVPGSDDEHR